MTRGQVMDVQGIQCLAVNFRHDKITFMIPMCIYLVYDMIIEFWPIIGMIASENRWKYTLMVMCVCVVVNRDCEQPHQWCVRN